MKNKQEELRNKCKYLKWIKGIEFYKIAQAIGMSEHAFYNFLGKNRLDLGYDTAKKLEAFIKEHE